MSMIFVEIKNFARRNGWTKDRVAILDAGDSPNMRILHKTRIRHTWWTHNFLRYPKGSVIFENWLRLDLATWTIMGKAVRVFEDNDAMEVLWQRQQLTDRVHGWVLAASTEDLFAAAELLRGMVGVPKARPFPQWRLGLERVILSCLLGIGLPELAAFASLVEISAPPGNVSLASHA